MKIVVVHTQAELDALPASFDAETWIEIRSAPDIRLQISKIPQSSHVEAWGSSHVVARGSSHVEARESSHVEAWESSHVVARGSSHVEARESSHVEAWESSHVVARESSHVVARGSSHVEARESSHVVARGSSHVEARESSHVVAWGSSHVEARESSHVVAWESSHVEAWGSSHVEAWGSSHVEARESSHVEAWGSVAVHVYSSFSVIDLFSFAVAILLVATAKVASKSPTATIVQPSTPLGTTGWLEAHAIEPAEKVVLYKRVSRDWKTQENTPNETVWKPGGTLEHPRWAPDKEECGSGKFHAVARPYFADEFRSTAKDRYVAIEIAIIDLHTWDSSPEYPHKVAFRKGTVLYEVDRFGNRLAQ